jgi:hypothetical protein
MAFTTSESRLARANSVGVIVFAALAFFGILALAGGHGVAQEVLTNDGVVKMVKAGLPEAVIIQKIRSSERKFDTSTDALVRLKSAGVPDKVIEAMLGAPAAGTPSAAAPSPAAAGEPAISHVAAGSQRRLKSVTGNMEVRVEPFGGSRQEVVLPEPKAQYRIAEKTGLRRGERRHLPVDPDSAQARQARPQPADGRRRGLVGLRGNDLPAWRGPQVQHKAHD